MILWHLIKKEIVLEWRQKYALGGMVLYVLSTVFVIYLSVVNLQPATWNTLYWITFLFASVNAMVKSFVQESTSRSLYYYSIASPTLVLLAKITYNTLLMTVLSLLSYTAFSIVGGNPVRHPALFLGVLFMGSLGFAIVMTFIAAIAGKTNNSATIMAVLAFPVILPVLMLLINMSVAAIGFTGTAGIPKDMLMLAAIDLIALSASLVLFPYLWKE